MAIKKKALPRRTFLRGAGQVMIALPFLDAMIPTFARAQSTPIYRFVPMYYGSCNGGVATINPASIGPLNAPLGTSIQNLESVKNHISVLSNIHLEVILSGIPGPGQAQNATHGKMESPAMSGVRSLPKGATGFDNIYSLVRGTTSDQIAASFLGTGSKFKSIQLQMQAARYNGSTNQGASISAIKQGSVLSELRPVISPLEIYNMMFAGFNPGSTNQPPVSSLPGKKKSVLDFVIADANRLINNLSGQDKERMELHFEGIREIERSLANTTPPPSSGSCAVPSAPGNDPAINDYAFGGWANETLRGELQADLIAHALACDLTRVASWQLTAQQVFIGSANTSGSNYISGGRSRPDIHQDSHGGGRTVNAANHNWAVRNFGLLVDKLSKMQDAHGSILDHTFISFSCAEGISAHNRNNMTYLVAGCPQKIKNGHHVNTNGAHPAQVLISGLQAIGMNTGTLGEVTSGSISGLMK